MSETDSVITLKVPRNKIALLNWIFEGYEHLGLVSTIDRPAGIVVVRTTAQLYQDTCLIINNLPFEVEIL